MKKLFFLIFLFFSLSVFSQNAREFGKIYGDEPWHTYDKKNIGGTLIAGGWLISSVTFIATKTPTTGTKIVAYGVGPSLVISGLVYWVIKEKRYKRKQEYLSIKRF